HGAYPDGVWFAGLAALNDPAFVPGSIAAALNVQDNRGQPVLTTLVEHLNAKHLLLVLDNVEHVIDAADDVVALLAGSPALTVLVTSRVPLHVLSEREYPVHPLSLPGENQQRDMANVTQSEAVRMFVERARAVKPAFALTNETAPVLAQICARLDGLPLAIELAAAHVRVYSPRALLQRLDRRLPLLVDGARDLPARQQSLRSAIGWSYDHLSPDGQALFRRLAVFRGGWDLDAAEAVGRDLAIDVLAGLERLVEHNLVLVSALPDGEPRFTMLETIREFGLEQLGTCGEESVARSRHAEHMLAFAARADAGLRSIDGDLWLEKLFREEDNLREALRLTLWDSGDRLIGLQLVGVLFWFWFAKAGESTTREALGWLERAFEVAPPDADPVIRAKAMSGFGLMLWLVSEDERAKALFTESREIFRLSEEAWHVALVTHQLAHLLDTQGYAEEAFLLFQESLDRFEQLADPWGIVFSRLCFGSALIVQDQFERARELLEQGLERAREFGEEGWVANTSLRLGELARSQGDLQTSVRWYADALTLFHRQQWALGVAHPLVRLAQVSLELGHAETAARLLGASHVRMVDEAFGRAYQPIWGWYGEAESQMRERLGDDDFQRLWEAGRAMSMAEAVEEALSAHSPAG
ncbi:MAG: tetratricopeptide repeat protein, partial [Thermomicrobiales bacterium]